MKVLVTGSSGHLGEALVRVLRQSEHEVIGVDLLASEFTDQVGSLVDRDLVRRCMQGVDAVLHTATLHKPHVVTHSRQDFVDTNITATLHLLEEAHLAGVQSFIYTSTTSTFGDALRPAPGAPAVWITEEVRPQPKNIYGVTKTAAEDLCQLFFRNHGLPCLILRTSRFFPEEDDRAEVRQQYSNDNIKANELLFRRADIADIVSAHLKAMEKAPSIGFERYIISATSPFVQEDLAELNQNAHEVVRRLYFEYDFLYKASSWKMFPQIGRVYVNRKARWELDWEPRYDFRKVLDALRDDEDFRSPLARVIGSKGYHDETFEEGPYPV